MLPRPIPQRGVLKSLNARLVVSRKIDESEICEIKFRGRKILKIALPSKISSTLEDSSDKFRHRIQRRANFRHSRSLERRPFLKIAYIVEKLQFPNTNLNLRIKTSRFKHFNFFIQTRSQICLIFVSRTRAIETDFTRARNNVNLSRIFAALRNLPGKNDSKTIVDNVKQVSLYTKLASLPSDTVESTRRMNAEFDFAYYRIG